MAVSPAFQPQFGQPNPPAGGIGGRVQNLWRGLFAPGGLLASGDLLTLFAAVALLLMPAFSLAEAGWALSMPIILPLAVSSVVIGYALARSRYDELLALFLSLIYGVCAVLIFAALAQPTDLLSGVAEVFRRVISWTYDVFTGGINQDDLVFSLLIGLLFWSLGFNLAWHLFRIDRLWRAVLPPVLVLLVNVIYYTGPNSLDRYLIISTLLILLLLVRSNLEARAWDWYLKGVRVPRALRRQVFIIGAILTLIVLGVAWAAPRSTVQERLNRFQELLQSEPLQELAELWNRLFSSPETQGPSTSDYYGGDSLQLGGAIRLGDEIVFSVQAPTNRRYYWRSRTFDTYDFGRWNSEADIRLTDPEAPFEVAPDTGGSAARVSVNQTFTLGLQASRLIYTAPQPQRIDLATRTDLRYAPDNHMNVSAIRPLRVLNPGTSYTATSAMSEATAAQLRAAGQDYPEWIRTIYGSYIPTATGRTVQLAAQLIADSGATNPYDAARAVEGWLRTNIEYNETIPAPPTAQDPVDWVLFDFRQGYCNYYASAMVVMLRTQGIPARMAAGFAQGSLENGAYVVRERDAHTWVEVYFPGYGWVEFEPTSAQAPVTRSDEPTIEPTQNPQQPVTPTQVATSVPTSTPLPTATLVPPTPTAGSGEAEGQLTPTQDEGASAPLVPPTATPTFLPTLTPTPVPVAPPEAPQQPPPSSLLQLLSNAIVLALIGVVSLFVLALVIAFIYWYWEWRGFRGMNPVARAYSRLQRYAALLGLRPSDELTPDERRARITRAVPLAEPPVSAITRLYTEQRYGVADDLPFNEPRVEAAQRAWSDARGGILRRWFGRRARFWQRDE